MKIPISQRNMLDVNLLSGTRALIQAGSGGGKSYLLRLIVEQAADSVPVIVIDPEGEFQTVRSVCSMILVGPGGELPVKPGTGGKAARGLLEQSCSAIVDLSELPARDHSAYVRDFLASIMSAPKRLWRPTVVAIDEAHRYCPEGGRDNLASDAVVDLMSRGRKRGYGGVLLTQRVSKIRKDAIAECHNVFMGRTTLDIDLKRAADMLGITPREAQDLRQLEDGQWYVYGPAVDVTGVEKIQALLPKTKPPEAGKGASAAVKVKNSGALSKLAEQIMATEDEPLTLEEAMAVVRKQKTELSVLKGSAAGISAQDLERRLKETRDSAIAAGIRRGIEVASSNLSAAMAELQDRAVRGMIERASGGREVIVNPYDVECAPSGGMVDRAVKEAARAVSGAVASTPKASGSAREKILFSLAWWHTVGVTEPDLAKLCFVAGLSPKSSTVRGARASLRSEGLIEYVGDGTSLTDAGYEASPDVGPRPTMSAWHQMVRDQIGGGLARDVFEVVLEIYPSGIDLDSLCSRINASPKSSTIRGALAGLRKLGLVGKGNPICGTTLLYPECLG